MEREKTIYTLGTSDRSAGEFLTLLRTFGVEMVVDVRSHPVGRFLHFHKERLSRSLGEADLGYAYLGKELGGYRRGGYEAHTQTYEYLRGLDLLERLGSRLRCSLICAERLPWRCHRRFIGRSLAERGWNVIHILEENRTWNPEDPGRGEDDRG
jgi:uncharacterized protein (DUF488 family)